MESVYVPTFQQGGGPGFEHTAPQPAAAATPTEAGAREHRFSPYVDNGLDQVKRPDLLAEL